MNQVQGETKIAQMIDMIKKEAQEKASTIIEEAKHKVQKEKNKMYNQEYERLIAEFKEKEENEATQRRLEKSRKINESRLDVQKYRSELLDKLCGEVETKLREATNDKKKYKALLKDLIVQGSIRLLEKEVWIVCRKQDRSLVEDVISDAKKSYKDFLKQNLNEDYEISYTVVTEKDLDDGEIGGVVLYSNRFKTVYNNSLKSRLHLAFENSTPDIRRMMFISLGKNGA
jgi:V-type H+-transporting ATPase subunit E